MYPLLTHDGSAQPHCHLTERREGGEREERGRREEEGERGRREGGEKAERRKEGGEREEGGRREGREGGEREERGGREAAMHNFTKLESMREQSTKARGPLQNNGQISIEKEMYLLEVHIHTHSVC